MASLVNQRNALKAALILALGEVEMFREHLASDKFKGTERTIEPCEFHRDNKAFPPSPWCSECKTVEHRKDWIATGDVERWLQGLSSTLAEALEP